MDHHIIKDITGGRMEARRVDNLGEGMKELDFEVAMLSSSNIRCSCGTEFSNEREAIEHLNEYH